MSPHLRLAAVYLTSGDLIVGGEVNSKGHDQHFLETKSKGKVRMRPRGGSIVLGGFIGPLWARVLVCSVKHASVSGSQPGRPENPAFKDRTLSFRVKT